MPVLPWWTEPVALGLLAASSVPVALSYRAWLAGRVRQGLLWIAVSWAFLTVLLAMLAVVFAVLTDGVAEVVLSGSMGAGALSALRRTRNGFDEWRRLS